MNKDLTVGNPSEVLWKFSIPLFGSVIFQQMYNIADSLIAGKFVGEKALAAVGNSYEITLIYLAFAFGCNIGTSVIVSQLFGARRLKEVKTAVSTSMIATGVLCLTLMALGFCLTPQLLHLIHTPDDVFGDCLLYMNIYTGGLLFLFFYNVSTGIFSALGDSVTPFRFLAVSSVANIIVDYVFVTAFHMGVAGVAWATFICQGISCVAAVITVMRRMAALEKGVKAPVFSVQILKKIMVVAIPSILQQSFISVGNILIQSVINNFGTGVMAGYSAAIKLNNLVITSFTTLGNGMSNYISQNLGAGRHERIVPGYRAGLRMVYLICVPVILLYWLAGPVLTGIFMDQGTAEAIQAGTQFLRIVSPFYPVVSTKLIADGVLRGAQAMRQFMAATFTDLILRVALVYVLSGIYGVIGIWCAWPVGWFIGTLVSICFYRKITFSYEKDGGNFRKKVL
ncbi:MAG: MATE family efflux transporter [Lachnospiraceae bacterium]|nr:MATE family efflux transporter [Lachnospiraceae bacterium]